MSILILSKNYDLSTDEDMEWLSYFGVKSTNPTKSEC